MARERQITLRGKILSVIGVLRTIARWSLLVTTAAIVLRQFVGPATGNSNYPGHSTDVYYLALWLNMVVWAGSEFFHLALSRSSSPLEIPPRLSLTGEKFEWSFPRYARWIVIGLFTVIVGVTYHSALESYLMSFADWNAQGSTSYVASAFPFPSVWDFGQFGSFAVLATRASVPFSMVAGMAQLGMGFAISERVVFIAPFIIASWFGVRSLARRLGVPPELALAAALIYLVNYSTIDWYAGGWFPILIEYGLSPLALSFTVRWFMAPSPLSAAAAGTAFGAVTILDVRNGLILAMSEALLIGLFLTSSGTSLRALFQTGVARRLAGVGVFLIGFGFTFSPQLVALWLNTSHHLNGLTLPNSYFDSSNVIRFSYYSLGDTMSLFNPWWPHFLFFQTVSLQALPAIALLPILAVASTVFVEVKSRNLRIVRLAGLMLYLAGTAFAAGGDSPFRTLNIFLWIHAPGFHYFRNPELWMQLALFGSLITILGGAESWFSVISHLQRKSRTAFTLPMLVSASSIVLVALWATLQGVVVSSATISTPTGNLTGHTSAATQHVTNYLSVKNATVLWIPTSPANQNEHAISSKQLTGVSLNPKNGVATFPNWSKGNIGAGSALYPALFSTPEVAWSFINKYRVGYIAVDRFSPPWEDIGLPNQALSIEAALRRLGLVLTFQNRQYDVFRANPTPLLETATYRPAALHPLQRVSASYPTSGFLSPLTPSTRNFSTTGGFAGHLGCEFSSQGCIRLDTRSDTPTISSLSHSFPLAPGDRVRVEVSYDTSHLNGGLLQVNQVCQNSVVSSSSFDASRGPTTASTEFEYTGSTTYSHCAIALALISPSSNDNLPTESSALVSNITLQQVSPASPLGVKPSSHFVVGANEFETSSLPHEITPQAQNSWAIHLGASTSPRLVALWQSYSDGWLLTCDSLTAIPEILINGWAMGFTIPAGRSMNCTLSFPSQATENMVVVASVVVPTLLILGCWYVERRRSAGAASSYTDDGN